MLKFICPSCKQRQEIEVILSNCDCHETIEFPSAEELDRGMEVRYGAVEVEDSNTERYQCAHCGFVIPVDGDDGDESLATWLAQQPYNLADKLRVVTHDDADFLQARAIRRLTQIHEEEAEILEDLRRATAPAQEIPDWLKRETAGK